MKIDNPLGDFWSLRPQMNKAKNDSNPADKAKRSADKSAGPASDAKNARNAESVRPQQSEKPDAVAGRVNTPAADTYETSRPKDAPPIREHKAPTTRRKCVTRLSLGWWMP